MNFPVWAETNYKAEAARLNYLPTKDLLEIIFSGVASPTI
jgi:hypothetical protein